MMGWGMGTSWMGGGPIIMILVWALIIVGIIFLVRWGVRGNRDDSYVVETPLEVLKKRYARGEIDRAQYERIKKDIS